MIVKGPFKFKWGNNVINNVSEMDFEYEVDSSETDLVTGGKVTVQKGINASVSLTLAESSIDVIAKVLPHLFKNKSSKLTTGQTVNHTNGAIDIAAGSCGSGANTTNNLDITSCGTDAEVVRLVNASATLDNVDFSDGLRQVTIKFIGEPASGEAVLQFLHSSESFIS